MSSHYAGMTINERLFASGLRDAWDAAFRDHDRAKLIAILDAVELGEQAASIVDKLSENRRLCGYAEARKTQASARLLPACQWLVPLVSRLRQSIGKSAIFLSKALIGRR
jgi:hypothetical protein